MSKLKNFLPLIIFLALGIFLLRGIELDPNELPSPLIGQPIPSFKLPALDDGRLLDAKIFKGQVVLLNVWATWCPACKMEHPYLVELSKQGVIIAGLNYKDNNEKAILWLNKLGNPYQFNIVDQQGSLGLDLGVFGAPETFLIDKEGVVRFKHVGVVNERVWLDFLMPLYKKYNEN